MTKAKHLKRGDTFSTNAPMKVLSVTPLANGLFKVTAETVNSPSMEFADGGCVLEIICKGYRPFSAFPYRDGDDGAGRKSIDPVTPIAPTKLEPVYGTQTQPRAGGNPARGKQLAMRIANTRSVRAHVRSNSA